MYLFHQVGGTTDNIEESCATFATRALGLATPLMTTHQIDNCTEGWYNIRNEFLYFFFAMEAKLIIPCLFAVLFLLEQRSIVQFFMEKSG